MVASVVASAGGPAEQDVEDWQEDVVAARGTLVMGEVVPSHPLQSPGQAA